MASAALCSRVLSLSRPSCEPHEIATLATQADAAASLSHSTPHEIPQATATLSFFQLIAGVIGLAICQSLLIGGLKTELAPYNLPAETILAITGSVDIIWTLPAELQKIVIEAYVTVLHHVYIVGVPTAVLGASAALLIRSHNIKKLGVEMGAAA